MAVGIKSVADNDPAYWDAALETQFLAAARQEGFQGLEGHRSLGGVRASLYNAVSPPAIETLCAWLADFADRHG